MNIDKMTLDECRDYIAERMGWTYRKCDCGITNEDGPVTAGECDAMFWYRSENGRTVKKQSAHPVPPTIDAIAASLPTTTVPHFWWHLVSCLSRTEKESWEAIVGKGPTELCDTRTLYGSEGNTEILARARAACFAWLVLSQESPK